MRKMIYLLLALLSLSPVAAVPTSLKIDDIPKVMERLFTFHIESKEMTPLLVRRSMKLYIEQFDPEKAYLLSEEVEPYLNMSDEKAKEILANLQAHDYSDFIILNGLFQESILRAQAIRTALSHTLVEKPPQGELTTQSKYPQNLSELAEKQKSRMARFYLFHKTRTNLDTAERRAKVFELFEKKSQRIENNFLFLNADNLPLGRDRIEYLLTLRILKSLAKSLDTHTSFFSPEEAFEMRMSLEKQFEGVGVVLSEGIDGVIIAELIKGSPAEQSGQIKVNDTLVEIDGIPTSGRTFEEVLDMLKKKDQGQIILGFKRGETTATFRVPLAKRPIVMNEDRIRASYERVADGIIGKITLYSFYESGEVSSEKDIKEAIRAFREKGELAGLILDLRENSGGFLSQAVKVAGLFLTNGVVVISKYGKGEVHYLRNIVSKAFYNGPLVVLTSKMSASASEIVAQALQDYGVALVVGDTRTFGKGSIQYQTVTDEKADIFFKVTVGRYYTPSGKSTQIDGVIADIVVPSLYASYKIGEQYLEYPLPRDKMDAAFVDPLTDLDERTRQLFQMRYLPTAQRVVAFWKKMLPELKKKSTARMAKNVKFQTFLKKQEAITTKAASLAPNTVDEQIQQLRGIEDLQMEEAVHIVSDMIQMADQAPKPLARTGSD